MVARVLRPGTAMALLAAASGLAALHGAIGVTIWSGHFAFTSGLLLAIAAFSVPRAISMHRTGVPNAPVRWLRASHTFELGIASVWGFLEAIQSGLLLATRTGPMQWAWTGLFIVALAALALIGIHVRWLRSRKWALHDPDPASIQSEGRPFQSGT